MILQKQDRNQRVLGLKQADLPVSRETAPKGIGGDDLGVIGLRGIVLSKVIDIALVLVKVVNALGAIVTSRVEPADRAPMITVGDRVSRADLGVIGLRGTGINRVVNVLGVIARVRLQGRGLVWAHDLVLLRGGLVVLVHVLVEVDQRQHRLPR